MFSVSRAALRYGPHAREVADASWSPSLDRNAFGSRPGRPASLLQLQERLDALDAIKATEGDVASSLVTSLASAPDQVAPTTESSFWRSWNKAPTTYSWKRQATSQFRVPSMNVDITDWDGLAWYDKSEALSKELALKGFCLLRPSEISEGMRVAALNEAHRVKARGDFDRPPREVLWWMLGPRASAWTYHHAGTGEASPCEAFCDIQHALSSVAHLIELSSKVHLKSTLCKPTVMVVHHSRAPEDGDNHSLVDLVEAEEVMRSYDGQVVKLFYYAGPSAAVLTVEPVLCRQGETPLRPFRTQLKAGTLLAIRCGVHRCSIELKTMETGVTFELALLRHVASGSESRRGAVVPADFATWILGRMKAIVDNEVEEGDAPLHWIKDAWQTFYRNSGSSRPVRVLQISHELPVGCGAEAARKPWDSAVLLGGDCIQEVPPWKWDVDAYYDEDPHNVDHFKMYTRHMGFLPERKAGLLFEGLSFSDFGIANTDREKAESLDPRHVMLCESATRCFRQESLERDDTRGKKVGAFCGISSNEAHFDFMTSSERLRCRSRLGFSDVSSVNHLSYLFGTTGPGMTIDTENSSSAAAVDTAVAYVRMERCCLALVGTVGFVPHPASLILRCASGTMSRSGRSRTFDESTDGFVRSEGVVTALFEAHSWRPRGEDFPTLKLQEERDAIGVRPLIGGSALNSKGTCSSLAAPSGPSIQDVVRNSLEDTG